MKLLDVHAVVTGGASGLGKATVECLCAAGASVTLLDRDEARGAAVAAENGPSTWFEAAEITDDAAVADAIRKAAARGNLRVAVNCVGYGRPTPLLDPDGSPHPLDEFRELIDVNLLGTINAMRHEASAMAATDATEDGERGVIINVSSIAGLDGSASLLAYGAAKAGLAAMTLAAARQLGPHGIRVVSIVPGYFATPPWLDVPAAQREAVVAGLPSPSRLGDPAEFAALVQHVVENRYLNGTSIRLDAGARM